MYPLETWCQISCILKRQHCVFMDVCPIREGIYTMMGTKSRSSRKRFVRVNGYGNHDQYIHVEDLIDLFRIYLMTGFVCWYCGEKMHIGGSNNKEDSITMDHRVPLARGGQNTIDNVVFCCYSCNCSKDAGDHPVTEEERTKQLLERIQQRQNERRVYVGSD